MAFEAISQGKIGKQTIKEDWRKIKVWKHGGGLYN